MAVLPAYDAYFIRGFRDLAGNVSMQADTHRATRRCSIYGIGALCIVLAGCSRPPAPTHNAAAPYILSPSPDYALSSADGLSPSALPLLSALMKYYRNWDGVPYLYGGTNKSGIDCSAFVRQTLAKVSDLALPRTTRGQVRRGYAVPRSQLRIGDLVFFRTGGGYRHVGIYVGKGRFMHVSSSVGVTISKLDNSYWRRHFWQARRLPDELQLYSPVALAQE